MSEGSQRDNHRDKQVWCEDPLPQAAHIELLVTNIGQLCTLYDPSVDETGPRRGDALARLGIVTDGAIAISAGRIVACGAAEAVITRLFGGEGPSPATPILDAAGCAVVPGFVDPHTHAVFGRTRQDEYERRIEGASYLEIAAAGGGIHASVADLRRRSEDELVALTIPRLAEMLDHGTTTVEIKSGYGLSVADELKMLRAARRAAAEVGVRAVLTCLAAHEIPLEYRDRRAAYVDLVCAEILPAVCAEGLASRCDVFCEPSVFGLDETRRILSRARELGLGLTVHADELEALGGAALAAELGAQSADHLIVIDAAGRRALAASATVAVLLPGTVFTLGLADYSYARALVEEGCAVALASDFNPGSCPIRSLPLIMALACTQMRLTPAEALTAVTLNAAWALGVADEVGSLAPGKRADFLLLDGDDHRLIPYAAGHNPVRAVYRDGRLIAT